LKNTNNNVRDNDNDNDDDDDVGGGKNGKINNDGTAFRRSKTQAGDSMTFRVTQ